MPKFSVVIPLFNKEKFILSTLKSVMNQNFKDFEVIIVDDGSTDNSLELIDTINDSRIQVLKQENQGVSVARNNGIKQAKTAYIAFLDADDIWEENHLEVLDNTIQKFPKAGMYCSRYVTEITKHHHLHNTFIGIETTYEGYVQDFFKSSLINRVALTSAVCIKKTVFDEIGGFNANISSGQDLEYWIRIALHYKIAITNKTTLIYNYSENNYSLSKTPIYKKKLIDFDRFKEFEQNKPSLKQFLDLYRVEYALNFYLLGYKKQRDFYLKNVDKKNIPTKTKLLLKLPPSLLRKLYALKQLLKKKGIDISAYY